MLRFSTNVPTHLLQVEVFNRQDFGTGGQDAHQGAQHLQQWVTHGSFSLRVLSSQQRWVKFQCDVRWWSRSRGSLYPADPCSPLTPPFCLFLLPPPSPLAYKKTPWPSSTSLQNTAVTQLAHVDGKGGVGWWRWTTEGKEEEVEKGEVIHTQVFLTPLSFPLHRLKCSDTRGLLKKLLVNSFPHMACEYLTPPPLKNNTLTQPERRLDAFLLKFSQKKH